MQSQNQQNIDTMQYVVINSQDVFINMKELTQLVAEVITYISHNYDNKNFNAIAFNYVRLSSEFHPDKNDKRAADWLFVLNTLNFALWTQENMKEWKVNGLTGYMALCAAIKRAIDDGKPMWDPKFYTTLNKAEMIRIFQGDDNTIIPHICRRLIILQEVGYILLNSYNGTFANCIKSCKHDAIQLMITIHNTFPSYYDMATYDERSDRVLIHGSREELEIRCCSLMIIRYMHQTLMDMLKQSNFLNQIPELNLPGLDYICVIDNFLWDYQQVHHEQLKKHVLCKIDTEYY